MLKQALNTPRTSSAGRLFDAVASLTGICQTTAFEGQAAMMLQFAAEEGGSVKPYGFELTDLRMPYTVDWEPMIRGMMRDLCQSVPVCAVAAKFHSTVVRMILSVASLVGERRVVLTGGCFQNRLLIEQSIAALRESGFEPCWNERVPCNDGGIALGQIAMASFRQAGET
jgi:hydrogenase maturation protein HypF